jgi:hypothetical protein
LRLTQLGQKSVQVRVLLLRSRREMVSWEERALSCREDRTML